MAKKRFYATVKPYAGKDPKKRLQYQEKLELAARIEAYINPLLRDEPRTFDYFEIAEGIGSVKKRVRDILFRCGGGSNGITL